MSLHESFDAKQARQNSRLDAIIAAAIAGPHPAILPAGAAGPSARPAAAPPPPIPSYAAEPPRAPPSPKTPDATTAERGSIGHGWDTVIATINASIFAQGGVLPGHEHAPDMATSPVRATINDPHGWCEIVDRMNNELPGSSVVPDSSVQQRESAASSWDEVIACMNVESGLAVPANR